MKLLNMFFLLLAIACIAAASPIPLESNTSSTSSATDLSLGSSASPSTSLLSAVSNNWKKLFKRRRVGRYRGSSRNGYKPMRGKPIYKRGSDSMPMDPSTALSDEVLLKRSPDSNNDVKVKKLGFGGVYAVKVTRALGEKDIGMEQGDDEGSSSKTERTMKKPIRS